MVMRTSGDNYQVLNCSILIRTTPFVAAALSRHLIPVDLLAAGIGMDTS